MSDHIYLNCNVTSEGFSGPQLRQAKYAVTYDQNIVDKASDYKMAVTKFAIPLESVPLILMPDDMVIGVVQSTAPFTPFGQTVVFVDREIPPIQGVPPNAVYNYDHFTEMVTTALQTAFVAAGSPGGVAPYFYWDVDNGRFAFGVNLAMVTAGWTIYWNEIFTSYVRGFDTQLRTETTPERYQLIIQPSQGLTPDNALGNNSLVTTLGWDPLFNYPVNTMIIKASYTSLDYFNSLRKILITTNSLPIQKEYYPFGGLQSGLTSTLGIVQEFSVDINNTPGAQQQIALYDADIYNFIDLLSSGPVRRIDLEFWWTDRLNNLYPLYVSTNQNITVKLLFQKKCSQN